MDPLDPDALNAELLPDSSASWAGGFAGPEHANERGIDVFSLVDALDLDDCGIPPPEDAEQEMLLPRQSPQ